MAKQGAEEPLFKGGPGQDDSFYETIDRSPEYDNNLNTKHMSAEDQAKEQEEWRKELLKLEEEIHTLQTVLSAKIRCAGELKRKLGVTPYVEFKQDLSSGIKSIKESDAYQKTSDVFKAFGAYTSKKLGDARNSNTFKSFEEKVGGAYTSVKTKVSGSRSENSFQELQNEGPQTATNEDASSTGGESATTTPTDTEKAVEPTAK